MAGKGTIIYNILQINARYNYCKANKFIVRKCNHSYVNGAAESLKTCVLKII